MSQAKNIYNNIKHRLPDRTNIYPTLNRAVRLVSKRLFYHKSNLVLGSLSVSITADTSTGTLPTDFWGLLDKPYISTKTYPLQALPNQRTGLLLTENSEPTYYKIVGSTLNLYPGSSSAITINGDYWTKPTQITKPTDTIPFDEQFDDVIEESLIHSFITGGTTGDANTVSLMRNFINTQVDEIVPYIENSAPKRVPDSMGLDYQLDGDYYGQY